MGFHTSDLPSELVRELDTIGAIRRYENDARLYLDDRAIYGRTTERMRDMMRRVVSGHRHATDGDPSLKRAADKAAEYGRVSYGYAGGWYDAVKRSIPADKAQTMLDGMWYFGEECEFVEFAFAAELTGSRNGYGGAWEIYRAARDLP